MQRICYDGKVAIKRMDIYCRTFLFRGAMKAKHAIFPSNYDSTQMFWMINKKGAYGDRY
jgi:hypothetical protein